MRALIYNEKRLIERIIGGKCSGIILAICDISRNIRRHIGRAKISSFDFLSFVILAPAPRSKVSPFDILSPKASNKSLAGLILLGTDAGEPFSGGVAVVAAAKSPNSALPSK
uniref:Uncharacterized protein n=1 Tax=Romanomermis culicivorax TaxID=13658 RepID=A0A915IN93_ROMCU